MKCLLLTLFMLSLVTSTPYNPLQPAVNGQSTIKSHFFNTPMSTSIKDVPTLYAKSTIPNYFLHVPAVSSLPPPALSGPTRNSIRTTVNGLNGKAISRVPLVKAPVVLDIHPSVEERIAHEATTGRTNSVRNPIAAAAVEFKGKEMRKSSFEHRKSTVADHLLNPTSASTGEMPVTVAANSQSKLTQSKVSTPRKITSPADSLGGKSTVADHFFKSRVSPTSASTGQKPTGVGVETVKKKFAEAFAEAFALIKENLGKATAKANEIRTGPTASAVKREVSTALENAAKFVKKVAGKGSVEEVRAAQHLAGTAAAGAGAIAVVHRLRRASRESARRGSTKIANVVKDSSKMLKAAAIRQSQVLSAVPSASTQVASKAAGAAGQVLTKASEHNGKVAALTGGIVLLSAGKEVREATHDNHLGRGDDSIDIIF